jgi:cytochrome P450
MLGLSNIIAGSDTTAVSLSSIFYNLFRTPGKLEKLRAEIRLFAAAGKIENNHITFKVSQEMRYLQACIKEGLRMHPATGLPLWRVVPAGGEQICGHYFPEGSEVGINTWVAHADQDIWGPDYAIFRPERWIEAEEEGGQRIKNMDAYYIPVRGSRYCILTNDSHGAQFGLGSRTCLGRHISYLEMCKLVPVLVSRFDFELVNKDRCWETMNYWFVLPTNFMVRVRERNDS